MQQAQTGGLYQKQKIDRFETRVRAITAALATLARVGKN
jgi:hypothetical protein